MRSTAMASSRASVEQMNIGLLKLSEAWIEPGSKKRLYRVGMLAEALAAARRHDVTWFSVTLFPYPPRFDWVRNLPNKFFV